MTAETGRQIGDYLLYEPLGTGGMATVHLGRARARGGFARAVAIKRMHPHLATEPQLVSMFLDEARIASRIRHPNVVSTLDLCRAGDDVIIVMDVVVGESLSTLLRSVQARGEMIPVDVATAIALDMLAGLHAAHEATDERGQSLGVIHRDVSPHNVLVGVDGIARVVDFGIAQAESRTVHTRTGELRGKLSYMAPERIAGLHVDRRLDVYAAAVVMWEMFAGRRLFEGDEGEVVGRIATSDVPSLTRFRADIPASLDDVIAAGMARKVEARHATAASLADALASMAPRATSARVGEWVRHLARTALDARQQRIVDIETGTVAVDAAPRSKLSRRGRARGVLGLVAGVALGAGTLALAQHLREPTAAERAEDRERGPGFSVFKDDDPRFPHRGEVDDEQVERMAERVERMVDEADGDDEEGGGNAAQPRATTSGPPPSASVSAQVVSSPRPSAFPRDKSSTSAPAATPRIDPGVF